MTVSLRVRDRLYEVGSADFFHAYFGTVAMRLEDGNWGSRFPALMTDLYGGRLPAAKAPAALSELAAIRAELAEHPPEDVVWDAEDRAARPPWGDEISPEITSLADYFWTSRGEPLAQVIEGAVREAIRSGADLVVE
jgi:hypothetical protein